MLSFSQLEFSLAPAIPEKPAGRDSTLEALARVLLLGQGATVLAGRVSVQWSRRLRSTAGRAESGDARILLNCRLAAHGEAEIDRTLRHELAHLLAQSRAGRRRIAPHGTEWRRACADLGIAGEARCHTLPFPIHRRRRRYLYACPHCR
ncbi:MAG TPA: SprT-like domain-containing protein, partial [Chthoniobacterales bacterium]